MALIPGFENDIFISYAHVDDKIPCRDDRWIEQFYKNLDIMFAKRFGTPGMVKIWWDDKKLDGSILFDASIEEGIKRSAVMICLISPGYLKSTYCRKELELFYKKAQKEKQGLQVANHSRIINVLLNNIPHGEWPAEISGATGFPFHDAKDPDDYGDPVDPNTQDFKVKLQALRDAVVRTLNSFLDVAGQEPVKEETAEGEGITIYMGEVADTLRTTRKRTIADLEKKGHRVLTGVPPPDEVAEHDKMVSAHLDRADISVHLLDQYPGKEIIGAPELWYPQKQAELGMELSKFPVIWMPAETAIESVEEEKYKAFLKDTETGKNATRKYEFITGSKSMLSQLIMDYAAQILSQKAQKPASTDKISVLLDTHYNDQSYAFDLGKSLLENQIQPIVNPEEGNPQANINILGERIRQVSKLIFIYGKVAREWVVERIVAAIQLILKNDYPIGDIIVYMAPPHKEANEIALNQRLMNIKIINSSNNTNIENEVLQQLLTSIKV